MFVYVYLHMVSRAAEEVEYNSNFIVASRMSNDAYITSGYLPFVGMLWPFLGSSFDTRVCSYDLGARPPTALIVLISQLKDPVKQHDLVPLQVIDRTLLSASSSAFRVVPRSGSAVAGCRAVRCLRLQADRGENLAVLRAISLSPRDYRNPWP